MAKAFVTSHILAKAMQFRQLKHANICYCCGGKHFSYLTTKIRRPLVYTVLCMTFVLSSFPASHPETLPLCIWSASPTIYTMYQCRYTLINTEGAYDDSIPRPWNIWGRMGYSWVSWQQPLEQKGHALAKAITSFPSFICHFLLHSSV